MKKVLFIFGTRPEAIKLAPLIINMRHNSKLHPLVCVTAQHREMLDQILEIFEIRPDFDLNIMKPNQSLFDITANALIEIKKVIDDTNPHMLIVQGDTTTTFVGALAGFYNKLMIGHVEAGLRTYKRYSPFPEEMNRVLTTQLTDLHFAPTIGAKDNLLNEGVEKKKIFITGNTGIDSLFFIREKLEKNPGVRDFSWEKGKLILVTGHRRENFGKGFENICTAIRKIAELHPSMHIVYPVHLNPNVKKPVYRILKGVKNISLIPPVDYVEFVKLMVDSHLILTDSGGVQEEAPSLGKPVLVLRNDTERPEGIAAGTAILVGTQTEKIIESVCSLIDDTEKYSQYSQVKNPYGDGKAAKKIIKIINQHL